MTGMAERRRRCALAGPVNERDKIPGLDVALGGGDTFDLGGMSARVLDVGGCAAHLMHAPGSAAAGGGLPAGLRCRSRSAAWRCQAHECAHAPAPAAVRYISRSLTARVGRNVQGTPRDTSPCTSASRRWPSWVTRSSPWAAAACSKAHTIRCCRSDAECMPPGGEHTTGGLPSPRLSIGGLAPMAAACVRCKVGGVLKPASRATPASPCVWQSIERLAALPDDTTGGRPY